VTSDGMKVRMKLKVRMKSVCDGDENKGGSLLDGVILVYVCRGWMRARAYI
jgi:hypothetical protein